VVYDPELQELEEAVKEARDVEFRILQDKLKKIYFCHMLSNFDIVVEGDYFLLSMWMELDQ
jgi:hypothetical protein